MPRNVFEHDGLIIQPLGEDEVEEIPDDFCLDPDLNDFFRNDCLTYERGLWAKNYKVIFQERPDLIVALVSLLNDSLRFESKSQRKKHVHPRKRFMNTLPAMKIGRMAVNRALKGMGIGAQVLNLLKMFFLTENRTGCRFITVDAYNISKVVDFYRNNGFTQIHDHPGSIKARARRDKPGKPAARTVSMFCPLHDLLQLATPPMAGEDSFQVGDQVHVGGVYEALEPTPEDVLSN